MAPGGRALGLPHGRLLGCMRKTFGGMSHPPPNMKMKREGQKYKKRGHAGRRIKGREGRKGRKEKKKVKGERRCVESKGGKARTGEEKKKGRDKKKRERKRGGEPEPTSRREQNWKAKDLELH